MSWLSIYNLFGVRVTLSPQKTEHLLILVFGQIFAFMFGVNVVPVDQV
jgi:hypothetical protein